MNQSWHDPEIENLENWWWSEDEFTGFYSNKLSVSFREAAEAIETDLPIGLRSARPPGIHTGMVIQIRLRPHYHLAPDQVVPLLMLTGKHFLANPARVNYTRHRWVSSVLIRAVASPDEHTLKDLDTLLRAPWHNEWGRSTG